MIKFVVVKRKENKEMDIHNFQLGSVFQQNERELCTRPVRAAKYQLGMENSWMVYFTNISTSGKGVLTHEGMKFFSY